MTSITPLVRRSLVGLTWAVALPVLVAGSGCTPDDGDKEPESTCRSGSEGCPCYGNNSCDSDNLLCQEGRCVANPCPPGNLGCACRPGGTCNLGASGVVLACVAGLCAEPPPCPAGTLGCPCGEGGICSVERGYCDGDNTCRQQPCQTGSLGCPCGEGGACTFTRGYCDTNNLCQQRVCPEGSLGCPCAAGAGCTGGDLVCNAGTCVARECPAGTLGCPCAAGGACPFTDGYCDDNSTCQARVCPAGTVGCPCGPTGSCAGDRTYCDNSNTCRQRTCPAGTDGCPCTASGRCGISSRGEELTCQAGVCLVPTCVLGVTGCPCAANATCSAGTDTCVEGFCQATDCVPGYRDCPCAGGSCASPDLTCRDGLRCVDNTGYLGGPCLADGACHPGNRCLDGYCSPCNPGTLGCVCTSGSACYGGLACQDQVCNVVTVSQIPANPRCYTPCARGLESEDGTSYQACPVDGLMTGCVGDLTCLRGSCVRDGEDPPGCLVGSDCPDHQDCIEGGCYSNCDTASDCTASTRCYRHVCRVPCATSASAGCATGTYCHAVDGDNGYCLPLHRETGEPQRQVMGSFALDRSALNFTGLATTLSFTITNNSPSREVFRVRKLEHDIYRADATQESMEDPDDAVACTAGRDCPLFWLAVNGDQDPETSVTVFAGESYRVDVALAAPLSAVRWQGTLEVISPRLGVQKVRVAYVERPEGRWTGTVYYFSTFGDGKLAEWRLLPPVSGTGITEPTKDTAQGAYPVTQERIGNAFVQRWGAFRRGRISWDEFQAVMTATRSESWRWPSVAQDCPVDACYLYVPDSGSGGGSGIMEYSSDTRLFPVPTGITELPIVMNLWQPDPEASPALVTGRIDSTASLQYAGNPGVTLEFVQDPTTCTRERFGACLTIMKGFEAKVTVGGRFTTVKTDTHCAARVDGTYDLLAVPWLVPGFQRATSEDPNTGLVYRHECRDTRQPFVGATQDESQALYPRNLALAASNPVPDGRARRRTLELVDGALVNQTTLIILFQEHFASFLDASDATGFSAYGYMVLERARDNLEATDANENTVPDVYEGSNQTDVRAEPQDLLNTVCTADLLGHILDPMESLGSTTADKVVRTIITGVPTGASFISNTSSTEAVHYVCVDTGLMDGGKQNTTRHGQAGTIKNDNACRVIDGSGVVCTQDSQCSSGRVCVDGRCSTIRSELVRNGKCEDGGPNAVSTTPLCDFGRDAADCGPRATDDGDIRVECPAGSQVIFFTVDPVDVTQADVAGLPCQQTRSCLDTYNDWAASGRVIQQEPAWRCDTVGTVFCDANRLDLRDGKQFYAYTNAKKAFVPLSTETDQAYRYKTRFRNRTGGTIGFAPRICIPNSEQTPYCYDPPGIERIRERVDCLLHVWSRYYETLSDAAGDSTKAMLDDYLKTSFSYLEERRPDLPAPIIHDGFERLYAELLIMLGDESYTAAFASRFDLAGSRAVSFEGSKFEERGINLSGVVGYEMHSLYQAVQYYQEGLDRFYGLSPTVWSALQYGSTGRNFVTSGTVTWYIQKLIRASTQKARAMSEIARRYQDFNRQDLARAVIERAYTGTYLEGVILSRMMLRVIDTVKPEDKPQIHKALENAQRLYRMAMLDMRNVYENIKDGTTYFGYAPDYVPLPALDQGQPNAFELVMARAQERSRMARDREDMALNAGRSFDTDAAQFQAELARIRNNYEGQLAGLCGTFTGRDGRVYAAIEKYAEMHDRARLLGNPCGLMGNGRLHDAMAQMGVLHLDARSVRQQYDNVMSEVNIERARVSAQCNKIFEIADYVYQKAGETNNLKRDITIARAVVSSADRTLNAVSTIANLTKCSVGLSTDCPMAGAALGIFVAATAVVTVGAVVAEGIIASKELEINRIERETAHWQTDRQCDQALIDSNARTATILLRLKELDLEMLKAIRRIEMQGAEILHLHNDATRIAQEQAETEQMAIGVESARNDPNVRIYKNDAIINADISFYDAAREAYRATKVFEYYTSQSYPDWEKLFLIRMVARGDYNLENYLLDLQNEFTTFEEVYGNPDTRVAIFSLRDDVLAIPRLGDDGTTLSQADRVTMLRERLADVRNLDPDGYLSFTFGSTLDSLSPLTRNHKVLYAEAEVIGSDVGDTLGRVYLKQSGTSVVRTVADDKVYYRFPERIAVINPFFNGQRIFTPEVYRNYRLRDRPFVNTGWQLVLNQRDERVNQDVNLQSLTDIRLYVFYTDFTRL